MITKDDLYQELKANIEKERNEEKCWFSKEKNNAKFNLFLSLIIIAIVVIIGVLILPMIDKQDNKLMFKFIITFVLCLLSIMLLKFKFKMKYLARELKSIQIKNIDDIIKGRIIQEFVRFPDTIECYKKRLKEATDNLREAEERLTLLKQLQWRYVKTLNDFVTNSGEFYSVLLMEGGYRFVAYVDISNSEAIISNLQIKKYSELFDPQKLTIEEAKLIVKREITDLKNEKPADIKDKEKLEMLIKNTISFYGMVFKEN